MKILAVDTALGACSAAVMDGDRVLAQAHIVMTRGHAEALAPMVESVMNSAAIPFAALDRLAVTTGPGTFTGQRVGLAFMRGLRIALNKPLIGVTTLAAMAAQAKDETGAVRAIALHDARRDEIYIEIEDRLPPSVMLFEEAIDLLRSLNDGGRTALAGTAAARACDALSKLFFCSSIEQPDALWVARLAARMPVNASAPSPLYLRPPDAKPSAVAP